MFGGRGDDYLNADDNLDTARRPERRARRAAVRRCRLRLWRRRPRRADGQYRRRPPVRLDAASSTASSCRSAPSASPTVNRLLSPHAKEFIQALGTGEGADPTIFEPNGELGLVDQDDPDWNDQHGGPRDPQPGNIGGVQRDTQGGPEDMANPPDCGCDFDVPVVAGVKIVKAVNGQDANDGTGRAGRRRQHRDLDLPGHATPRAGRCPACASRTTPEPPAMPRTISSRRPSRCRSVHRHSTSATPTATTCSTPPRPGSTRPAQRRWPAPTSTSRGSRPNPATGQTVTDDDPARYFGGGTPPPASAIRIEKAINAADPTRPTAAEDADCGARPDAAGRHADHLDLPGLQRRHRPDPDHVRSWTTSARRPTPADDFTPAAVTVTVGGASFNVGDVDRDGLLDAGEAWRFTSAGTAAGGYAAVAGPYANTAKVTGTVVGTGVQVQDTDPAHYLGSQTTAELGVGWRRRSMRSIPRPRRPTRMPMRRPDRSWRWAARWSGPTRSSIPAMSPSRSRR